jgi:phosphatidylserine decarboxylase
MIQIPADIKIKNSRIYNKWPLAREGIPFVLIGIIVTLLFAFLDFAILAVLSGCFTIFILYFFRDPERSNSAPDKALLTPADGTIQDIQYIRHKKNPLGKPAKKISIFMSVFNVPVNRIPIEGEIKEIVYNQGKFFPANLDKASKYNENNRVILQADESNQIVIIQIAGLIARRIACWVKNGDWVKKGQRFGLIRFGSRLDVYLPKDSHITAHVRQKVKAGETIIGYLP